MQTGVSNAMTGNETNTKTMATTTRKYNHARKPRVYPLEIHTFAECGFWTYGHHNSQSFINALSEYLGYPVASVNGFTQEYGYRVPAAHYSEYPMIWYPCNGPQRGARPITMCYDVTFKKEVK